MIDPAVAFELRRFAREHHARPLDAMPIGVAGGPDDPAVVLDADLPAGCRQFLDGEASRLMLILKTTAKTREGEKSAVFDEIDAGIGGRVAEAVGIKLKQLSRSQQVLCVTHHPQVAALADRHFVVEKSLGRNRTSIGIRPLAADERVNEIARMLAGEKITDSARTHAAEMIESARNVRARNAKR